MGSGPDRLRILLATDSFPPVCGGSGWSTYELARGLRERGHDVLVVKVAAGAGGPERETSYDALRVIEFRAWAPPVPGIRNYFKNERLYARLAPRLAALIRAERIAVIHGQHVLSAPPAVSAARVAGIPSVVTVRDYWPVCYRSDLLHTPRGLALCPGCSRAAGLDHGAPRVGVTGLAASVARSYLRSNMRRKIEALSDAGAVIAVSSVIARDLNARAPELAGTDVHVIPNPVNIAALRQRAAAPRPMAEPYALYAGKLAVNKGTDHLVEVVHQADLDWPLVVAGDGPDRRSLEAQAAASGRDIRFLGWLDQHEISRWLAHAAMLIFPSRGPESLSRVLLEASALGVPIAAMNTGGTADIVEDEITGLLSDDPAGLADDVRRIRHGEVLRHRLAAAAANRALEKFDAGAVVGRVEALYERLIREKRP
ncbi:MAG TPA: glycosyltransferase family 4 protein [Vicinamibacterales bacterium]|nr:glycosyltransferase family 4 protein [Vicinamibacterales bacterium]